MLPKPINSKVWRLHHLYKIKNKRGQLVTFVPNAMQRQFRVDSAGHPYIYIVKPRQFGFTTDAAIDMLDDACFVPGASSALIAHDRETLGKIFQIIKRAYENMPDELKPVTQYDTRNEYKFKTRFDGAVLENELYVAMKIRGTTVPRLHVSESAHIKERDELKMGAKQAVPIGGRIIEETTGNGMNEFYDDVMEALDKQKKGKSTPQDYWVCFYPWYSNPEYSLPGELPEPDTQRYGDEEDLRNRFSLTDGQLIWRRWKLDEFRTSSRDGLNLNVFQRFKQEYPATVNEAFQSGSGNVFDGEMIDHIINPEAIQSNLAMAWLAENRKDVADVATKFASLFRQGVRFWEMPTIGHKYVIGCDPSDGLGADFAAIAVWDCDTTAKVAEYYGKLRPDELAELCAEMGYFFNEALIGVENNMLSTVLFLMKIYTNYYYDTKIDERTLKRTKHPGWNTNSKTRDVMIDEFIILFEEGSLKIRSQITTREMKTFVTKENGKREHADGKNDDMLFADFIALQMRRFYPKQANVYANKPSGF